MTNVLVTGGAGFIGSHIVERLVRDGYDVTVLDDLRSGSETNLNGCRDKITFIHGSILDREALTRAMEGVVYVFHEAAIPSVPESILHPEETHEVNVTGTLRVLEVARKANVRRVIYASSSAVYGDSPTLPKHEDMKPILKSPYAAHKLVSEDYARLYTTLHGIETIGLRYFNVYGPRQDPHSEYSGVISKFITTTLHGDSVTIYGDGAHTRDFVYVDDVVDANMCAMNAEEGGGNVFNVGSGQATSLLDLRATIAREVGIDRAPTFHPAREGDILHSCSDIERAQNILGFAPRVSLEEGLRNTIAFYRQ
jgi:UDP-glucose 4-epimerase